MRVNSSRSPAGRYGQTLWRASGVHDRTELYFVTAASPAFVGEAYPDLIERAEQDDAVVDAEPTLEEAEVGTNAIDAANPWEAQGVPQALEGLYDGAIRQVDAELERLVPTGDLVIPYVWVRDAPVEVRVDGTAVDFERWDPSRGDLPVGGQGVRSLCVAPA